MFFYCDKYNKFYKVVDEGSRNFSVKWRKVRIIVKCIEDNFLEGLIEVFLVFINVMWCVYEF